MKKLKTTMIKLTLLIDREDGMKLIKVYWDGIKFAIKFVDDFRARVHAYVQHA